MNQMTDWFPASVLPVRAGTYEIGHDPKTAPHFRNRMHLTGHRRYFDGVNWRAGWLNEQISIFGQHLSHQWRGLKQEPK